jgi:hypothetical protein
MNEFGARFRAAHGHLGEAVVVPDEVERGLAVAHSTEVKAEREGSLLVRAVIVIAGAAIAAFVGVRFLRWFFEKPEALTEAPVAPDGSADRSSDEAPWSR